MFFRRPDGPNDKLSESAQWRLLEMVYTQSQLQWANAAIIAVVGIICWVKTGNVLALVWLAVGMVLASVRLIDFYGFPRRRLTETADRIKRRFVLTAWAIAAVWGAASAILLLTDEAVPRLLTLSAQTGYLASSMARNNPVRRAALGQICLVLGPLTLVCLLYPDPTGPVCAIAALIYLASIYSTGCHLHRQSVRLIVADDENAELVRSVRTVNAELEAANLRLEVIASTDGLTGAANRRSFDRRLQAEWQQPGAGRLNVGLLMIDIDHFKAFNDFYGHLAGDRCLRLVARCIEDSVRQPNDFTARYGGEEFAVILPQTDDSAAAAVAERIRAAVQAMGLAGGGPGEPLTVSIGVAAMRTGLDVVPDRLIALTDRRLYEAKRAGRNCVRGAGGDRGAEGMSAPYAA